MALALSLRRDVPLCAEILTRAFGVVAFSIVVQGLTVKPVVILTTHGFDRRPYLHLRIKCYVYDHRFELHIQSDITARASRELLRCGILQRWFEHAALDPPGGGRNGAGRIG